MHLSVPGGCAHTGAPRGPSAVSGLRTPLPLPPEVAIIEHFLAVGVQRPVVAFTRVILVPRDLPEAVVEGEVVSDGVLPARLALLVEGEVLGHVLVDLAEGPPPARRACWERGNGLLSLRTAGIKLRVEFVLCFGRCQSTRLTSCKRCASASLILLSHKTWVQRKLCTGACVERLKHRDSLKQSIP